MNNTPQWLNWEHESVPKWAKYAARDESGRCFVYDQRPITVSGLERWYPSAQLFETVPIQAFTGSTIPSWRESLIERPSAPGRKREGAALTLVDSLIQHVDHLKSQLEIAKRALEEFP